MHRVSALKQCSEALQLCSAARRSVASLQRAKLRYIPLKVKEEMLALHEEDGSRWNATTLSARFSAPLENVEALLKLARFRAPAAVGGRERRTEEEKKTLEKLRGDMMKAWKGAAQGREVGVYTKGERRMLARPSEIGKGEAAAVAAAETAEGEGSVEGTGEEGGSEEGAGKEEGKVLEKSATAKWIEKRCEEAERDVKRRTTFAFIEVGGKGATEMERAVWIREGGTGKLRVASEMERKVLLEKVRVVDSGLWR